MDEWMDGWMMRDSYNVLHTGIITNLPSINRPQRINNLHLGLIVTPIASSLYSHLRFHRSLSLPRDDIIRCCLRQGWGHP